MRITIKDDFDRDKLLEIIDTKINFGTRFVCEPEAQGMGIKIRNIRLKEKKEYCGNHPAECIVIFGPERTRRGVWLEGLDWVEFNDRINDILDELNISANVYTSVCHIRKGERRRIHYGMWTDGRFNFWAKHGNSERYEDWRGKIAPNSIYPEGTPGYYLRELVG
jgi:hypothetical protein